MMEKRNVKGITLIALAVTIIVILILAGVTIGAVFSDNGIINKAKEAANAMNNAVANDQASLNDISNVIDGMVNGNGGTGDTNTEPETPEEEGTPIADLVNDGTIKVGDYVKYEPTGDASYHVNGEYSGTETEQVINKESLNWRVLGITDEGKVRLISEYPTEAKVEFNGANGYNNGVYLLDELCNTLYKGEYATAKSLKIEDIQNNMDLKIWDYHSYENYGLGVEPYYKRYPLILAEESGQHVDGEYGSLDVSEQTSIIKGSGSASDWYLHITSWKRNMTPYNYKPGGYYKLFHQDNSHDYWLSSRCFSLANLWATFSMRKVDQDRMSGAGLYRSDGKSYSASSSVRPVVTLGTEVVIDTTIR